MIMIKRSHTVSVGAKAIQRPVSRKVRLQKPLAPLHPQDGRLSGRLDVSRPGVTRTAVDRRYLDMRPARVLNIVLS
jgi:hypothetical protein